VALAQPTEGREGPALDTDIDSGLLILVKHRKDFEMLMELGFRFHQLEERTVA